MCNLTVILNYGFPGGSVGKESACNAEDLGSVPGLGRSPGGGHGNPLQYSCLENPHGQRSLAGCSPWGRKELDMSERLSTAHIELSHICRVASKDHSPQHHGPGIELGFSEDED